MVRVGIAFECAHTDADHFLPIACPVFPTNAGKSDFDLIIFFFVGIEYICRKFAEMLPFRLNDEW